MRLDAYVAQYWPEHSRSTWQKYIAAGYVQVNGAVEISVKRMLDEDDEVSVYTPEKTDYSDRELPVIYQDEHVIVINKPAGVLTHSKGAMNDEFTVAEFIRPSVNFPEVTNRNGIVHRLDRDTSGVIICARDKPNQKLLQKQFQDRKTKKTYIAVVSGKPKLEQGTIDLPIERNPKKPSSHRVGVNGKPAQTDFRVLASNKKYSVVELKPYTGRTHQLRVHMAYAGTPIVGDSLYGGAKSPIGRLCLHAEELELTIPTSRREVFRAPVPNDMQQFVEQQINHG